MRKCRRLTRWCPMGSSVCARVSAPPAAGVNPGGAASDLDLGRLHTLLVAGGVALVGPLVERFEHLLAGLVGEENADQHAITDDPHAGEGDDGGLERDRPVRGIL